MKKCAVECSARWCDAGRVLHTVSSKEGECGRIQRMQTQPRHVHDHSDLRDFVSTLRAAGVVETSQCSTHLHAVEMRGEKRGGVCWCRQIVAHVAQLLALDATRPLDANGTAALKRIC